LKESSSGSGIINKSPFSYILSFLKTLGTIDGKINPDIIAGIYNRIIFPGYV
jgi:hypothetical protein